MFCNLNGKVVEVKSAGLSLNDLGIVRGYGYFDYLRTYSGIPLFFDDHLDRLERSAAIVGLPIPYPRETIKQWTYELLKRNNFPEAHIKIVVTGGPSEDSMTVVSPSFYILATEAHAYPQKFYAEGVGVILYEHIRPFSDAKTLHYMTALSLAQKKKEQGAFEVIYVFDGKILEASTSNLFLFAKEVLITPKQDILEGITRAKVIELAKKHFSVVEQDVTVKELLEADEVFLTASNKEIIPVVRVDKAVIGTGKPGKKTLGLLTQYRAYVDVWVKEQVL
jgi:branched-subunit amino acid aminotransferase/4-amino-4-deoxychorismate lyase